MDHENNGPGCGLEHSRVVATRDNGKSPDDFYYFQETLFQTSLKQFFLLLLGKALTLHNPHDDTTTLGGVFFKPLTDSQAADWIAEHDLADQLGKSLTTILRNSI